MTFWNNCHRGFGRGLLAVLGVVYGCAAASGSALAAEMAEAFVGPVHLDDSALPDKSRTPGDAMEKVKPRDLCDKDKDARPRVPTPALCDGAFKDYGIPPERQFQFKCNYLVPLSIGGAATQMNVWPQPLAEAAFKDAIDAELLKQVCEETVSPVEAQRGIAIDWIETYRHFLNPGDPMPVVLATPQEAEARPRKPKDNPASFLPAPMESADDLPPASPPGPRRHRADVDESAASAAPGPEASSAEMAPSGSAPSGGVTGPGGASSRSAAPSASRANKGDGGARARRKS
jgi:hypothetical protein